jgi:predicted DNA binding protein
VKQINGFKRLTKKQLEDYYENSGITELQYRIIKYRYFDRFKPTIIAQCRELGLSEKTYQNQLDAAIKQITEYLESDLI